MTTSSPDVPPPGAVAARDDAPALRQAWMDRLRITVITGVIIVTLRPPMWCRSAPAYEERTTNTVTIGLITVPMVTALLFGLGPLFLLGRLVVGHVDSKSRCQQISTRPTNPAGCSDRHLRACPRAERGLPRSPSNWHGWILDAVLPRVDARAGCRGPFGSSWRY